MADFCADAPGRRAGICQIMLHDVEGSVAEIRWAAEAGLTGGVLLPGAPPGSDVPPLYAPDYEPVWSVCEAVSYTHLDVYKRQPCDLRGAVRGIW